MGLAWKLNTAVPLHLTEYRYTVQDNWALFASQIFSIIPKPHIAPVRTAVARPDIGYWESRSGPMSGSRGLLQRTSNLQPASTSAFPSIRRLARSNGRSQRHLGKKGAWASQASRAEKRHHNKSVVFGF